MARAGISYSDVTTAVSALQGGNQNVTIENIRRHLGTGSNSTIAQYLKTWRTQQEHGFLLENSRLPEEVLAFAEGLWQRLQEEASTQIKQARDKATVQQQSSQVALVDANQQLSEQKNKIHSQEETLQNAAKEKESFQQQLTQETNTNSTLTERTKNLEKQAVQWENKYNELQQLLKNTQQNMEHYQQSAQQSREKQALLIDTKEQAYRQKLDALLQQHTTALNQAAEYKAQLVQGVNLEKNRVTENNQLANAVEGKTKENQSLRVQVETLSLQMKQTSEQHSSQQKTLVNKQEALIKAEAKLELAKEQINQLEQAIIQNEDKVEKLRSDNLFLTQEKADLAGQFRQLQSMIKNKETV